jgi:uncharacterized protein (TIGR00106 family)
MSVIMEFAMFPTTKGESVSEYVSRIIGMLDSKGVDYRLNPMGTTVEVDRLSEALGLLEESYGQLEPDCDRVYSTIKLDIRKGKSGRMAQKVESVERRIGKKVS